MFLLAMLCPTQAHAQGFSTDIELVRPSFSPGGTSGVDSPIIDEEGRLQLGAQFQFTRDPLRLIEFGQVRGAVVRNRTTMQLGGSYAISNRVALRGSIPLGINWGSEIDDLSGDGFGVGDLSAGLRYTFYEQGNFTLGAHGDLRLNLGTRGRYFGETQPRTWFGLLAAYRAGPVLVLSNLGVETRFEVDTSYDFQLGDELVWNSALVVDTPVDDLQFQGQVLSRYGMARLFAGGAESSMEWTAGVRYALGEKLALDLGFGRGITAGYGTSSYRMIAGIRYDHKPPPPPEPEPEFVVEIIDVPEDEPDEPPETVDEPPPEEDGWKQGELARKVDTRIEIRDPIQFAYGTARLLISGRVGSKGGYSH